ncbi:hypothetical protein Pelo_18982 [Pelomyxa schiedti]|nr:hypothetical protein Pelo_18982 [Pelomyxa schiedti]
MVPRQLRKPEERSSSPTEKTRDSLWAQDVELKSTTLFKPPYFTFEVDEALGCLKPETTAGSLFLAHLYNKTSHGTDHLTQMSGFDTCAGLLQSCWQNSPFSEVEMSIIYRFLEVGEDGILPGSEYQQVRERVSPKCRLSVNEELTLLNEYKEVVDPRKGIETHLRQYRDYLLSSVGTVLNYSSCQPLSNYKGTEEKIIMNSTYPDCRDPHTTLRNLGTSWLGYHRNIGDMPGVMHHNSSFGF